ncbi:MAG TPA: gliding motility lipoprotein GldD [Cyclobacteriaceae bacterium]|nr:gliding motility lipoprotein GldD [Cyclobacteriaceae bacterium]
MKNKFLSKAFGILAAAGLIISSCSTNYQPKPIGYNRLILPVAAYQHSPDTLPYQFEYSQHARLVKDSSWMRGKHWVEIYYPELKSTIHVTYKSIHHDANLLKEFLKDAYVLTAKHQVKAYAIDETIVKTPSGKTAIIAELEGEVPSQFQFTLTDSTENFLRGAVYFNVKVQNDSLQPAIEYMKKDAMHLVNTLVWKK